MKERFKEIESRWQGKWERAKLFEANPDPERRKAFVTFPYPYVNMMPHIGHALSFIRADVWARFKRAQGFNVLFPQAFHFTGEPLMGAVERVRKGDEVQLRSFREAGLPRELWENPLAIAKFFMQEWIKDLKGIGASVDWRRTFYTTSHNPHYNRFVEWQYRVLNKKGYVRKGTHPVIWCPHCKSPTGDHARVVGEGVSPVQYVLIKFELDEAKLPAATLRPETIYGVTNVWLNPDSTYVKARVDGEVWILSEGCVQKLRDQLHDVEVIERFKGSELMGKSCLNPVLRNEVRILPAKFVDVRSATGVVMSVPAHAPLDWLALQDLRKDEEALKRYGLSIEEIEGIKPVSLIQTEGFGEFPAIEVCQKLKVRDQLDPKAMEATELVYKKEFYQGKMKAWVEDWADKLVADIKEALVSKLEKQGLATQMWECADEVVCRCLTRCHVKVLKDQWFLAYSDPGWKARVLEHIKRMEFWPEEARHALQSMTRALKDKACARKTGLGTPLPWDPEWIVESLSDSTIYPAFYTIAHKLNDIPAGLLRDEVFDFIFLGKGKAEELATDGLSKELLEELRQEFAYWYPVDLRNSGKDLLFNHLIFYIYHHVAIFPKELWPRAIGANGWVCIEGKKMSKSKGIYITLRQALEEWGADVTRANLMFASKKLEDADWKRENALAIQKRISMLYELASNPGQRLETRASRWLWSRLQSHIESVAQHLEKLETSAAFQRAFYQMWDDVRWYRRRSKLNPPKEFIRVWASLLAPFIPHCAEELWSRVGGRGFVAIDSWPLMDKELVDKRIEELEEMLRSMVDDLRNLLKLVGKKERAHIYALTPEELEHLRDAVDFVRSEFGFKELSVWLASDPKRYDPQDRAKRAKRGRPAIYLE